MDQYSSTHPVQCSRYPDSGDVAASKRKEFPSNYNLDAFPSNAPAISYKPGGNFSTETHSLFTERLRSEAKNSLRIAFGESSPKMYEANNHSFG